MNLLKRIADLGSDNAGHFAQLWGLTDLSPLAETHTSFLWRAETPEGPAVLKLLKPEGLTEMHGAAMLSYWHGLGAARLLASEDHACLMEYLPGPTLRQLVESGQDAEATRQMAQVIRLLHRPRNFAPKGLVRLDKWLEPLTMGTHHGWPGHSGGDMLMAKGLARRMLASSPGPAPLHGDLHHENVIWSGSAWKAIDPKGLSGDPAFDGAMAFRNPEGLPLLQRDYARISFMAAELAAATGYTRERLLGWAAVQCAAALIWQREVGRDCTNDLALLPRLLAAYGTAGS